MKILKTAVIFILVLNLAYSFLSHFTKTSAKETAQLQYNTTTTDSASGLSLQALTGLIQQVRSGQELEKKLNRKDSINNLDLNADNKVDYIFVREFGDTQNKLGLSLYTEPIKGEKQEVASVIIEKNGDQAEIQTTGNKEIYGENQVYNATTTITREVEENSQQETTSAMPYYASYFMMRPLYYSPFYYGYYPPYYSPFGLVPYGLYRRRFGVTRTIVKGRNSFQSRSGRHIANPNKGMAASHGIARSLRKPTTAQKSFYKTASRNRSVGRGGFGNAKQSHRLRPFTSNSNQFFSHHATRRSRPFSRHTSRSFGGFGRSFGRSSFRGFGRHR